MRIGGWNKLAATSRRFWQVYDWGNLNDHSYSMIGSITVIFRTPWTKIIYEFSISYCFCIAIALRASEQNLNRNTLAMWLHFVWSLNKICLQIDQKLLVSRQYMNNIDELQYNLMKDKQFFCIKRLVSVIGVQGFFGVPLVPFVHQTYSDLATCLISFNYTH